MENQAVKHIKDLMEHLSPAQRKQIKPDPLALSKKWGDQVLAISKKVSEIEDMVKSLGATQYQINIALKQINGLVPADVRKQGELTVKLLGAFDADIRGKWMKKLDTVKKPA